MATIQRIKLGSQGWEVSAQGLCCMGMPSFYGPPKAEADMISLIYYAIDSGITFLDTSDFYRPFINEILIGQALKDGVREKVELGSKFGIKYEDGVTSNNKLARDRCECGRARTLPSPRFGDYGESRVLFSALKSQGLSIA